MTTSAVVTGLGIAAPNGLGTQDYWDATRSGRSGIRRITRFDPSRYPARLAGEIPDFVAEDHLPSRLLPQTDRMTRIALVAADWALADAGVRPQERPDFDMGVVTASASGGFEFGQGELRKLWSQGSQYVSAYQSFAWFYAVNSGQISIRHGMKGPSGVVVSDQAGGLDALAQARRLIRKGTSLIVSGAVDASICPWGWVAQLASGRLSTSEEPGSAYLPFDAGARGHVPGEGGAILLLESARAARDRGARAYGEIAGYGSTFDPRPGTGRAPGLRKAIETALADAGADAGDIDVVFADAAAVPELDRTEAEAIGEVFGEHGVPVTAPKTMTGRLYSGAAPVDVATALLAIGEDLIPPTVNVRPSTGYGLDLVVGRSRAAELRTALVLARGHGGYNSAMVVRAAGRPPAPARRAAPPTDSTRLRGQGSDVATQEFTVGDLKRILREGAGTDENVDFDGDILDTDFEALGYESLALLETGSRIEREFNVTFEDSVLTGSRTPRALIEAVNQQLAADETSAA